MNNLILYAIIIAIIYHLCFKAKEGYSERSWVSRDEENKLINEGIQAYKDYENETDPIKKKQKGEILSQIYSTLLRVNPNFFKDGIPDDIKRRMGI